MKPLQGTIVVVAGSSRGAGRGIALALGDAGATVYVAARTSRDGPKPADGAPGTVEDTAEQVCARGGQGIPVRADLSNEEEAAALFRRVEQEQGRLDLMVDSAWGANAMAEWSKPFWELSAGIWRDAVATIDAAWLTSVHAARIMVRQRRGLIVHVTDNLHPNPSAYRGQILWDLGHEVLNRMVTGMSLELKKSQVAVVGLNPGFMRTERVLMHMATEEIKKQFRFDLSESVEYIGRAAAALAGDANVIGKTGQLLWVAELAKEYGFTDIDGRLIPLFDPNAPMQAYPC
ncbi:MAG: SDR family NAD(P)-dependent oxidoreductase [Bryobacteraceae bacterium]|jgi:NAD(P)-dependent dehydrogenase (short-subunit alcohol dehydrogenase family)